jgi:hypothetical protein
MFKKNICLFMILLMYLAGMNTSSQAQESDYGLPGEYLAYEIGARASAMGGAMTGLADDVSAIFYNPAGLAMQNPVQIGLQHIVLFENTMFDFAGLAVPLPNFGTMGLGAVLMTSTGFDVRDENYLPVNISNSLYQGALYLSYAANIMPRLALGANLKIIHEDIFGHKGTGIGMDAGGLYEIIPEFQIGMYVNNALAPTVLGDTYSGGVTLGMAGKLFNDSLLLDADISKSFGNQNIKWCVGGQLAVYDDLAFLRAGLDDETRVTLGVGGKYLNITIDYSLSLEALGMTHKVSAGYSFGGYEVRISGMPKIFSPTGINKTTTFAIIAAAKYSVQSWEFNLKDQNGDMVRLLSGEDLPPSQIVWNGKDDRGLPATDGTYYAQLVITDINGKVVKSNVESVRLQSSMPFSESSELKLE